MKRTLLSLIAVLAITMGSFAQNWIMQGLGWATASRGVQNISLVNDTVAWAAGYDGSGSGGASQDVSVTKDGGNTWTPHVINGAAGLAPSMIFAINENTAWCAMYKVSGSSLQGIYKTNDGGATWARQGTTSMFTASTSFPNIVYFWDANNGVCMGDPVSSDFEIYTTTDGGTTWTQTQAANIPNALTGEYGYTSDCYVVGNTLWFGTNKGHIYKTADKGLNWTSAAPPGMTGKNLTPCFKDANTGFSMKFYSTTDTLNLLTKSTDGGATFTAFTYAGSVFNQNMVFLPGSMDTYVTSGVDGTYAERIGISYSFDGGATWFTEPELFGTQITWTSWLNDSIAYAGTFNSDVTDGMYKFNSKLIAPSPDFSASDTAIELGGSITFTDMSTGGITNWKWTFPGGTPPSSNVQNPPPVTYVTPGAHDVTLKVSNQWGSKTLVKSGYIYVGGVGINELSSASINVYPNPVKDVLNVQSTSTMKEIQIYNIVGQMVLNQNVNGNNVTLNTSDLKSGVYNLKVKMEDGFINKKIVVN